VPPVLKTRDLLGSSSICSGFCEASPFHLFLRAPPVVAFGITRDTFYLALPSGDTTSGKGSLRSVLVARRCPLRADGVVMLDDH